MGIGAEAADGGADAEVFVAIAELKRIDLGESGVEVADISVGVDDSLHGVLGGAGGGVFLKKLMSGKGEFITI